MGQGRRCCVCNTGVQHGHQYGTTDVERAPSFAQFEREVTAERIRDKIAASKKKGLWMGGNVPLGYEGIRPNIANGPGRSRVRPDALRPLRAAWNSNGCDTRSREARIAVETSNGQRRTPSGGSVMGRGQNPSCAVEPGLRGAHPAQARDARRTARRDHRSSEWEAVESRLMGKSSKPRGKPATAHPSPLAGKLYDETGDRLTPSMHQKAASGIATMSLEGS